MVFEYSYGWILPAFIVAITIAYFKFKKLSKLPDIRRGIVLLISGIRFLVFFTLLLLLLSPAISLVKKWREKPLVVLAQDNSSSLVKNKDSLYYRTEYIESLERVIRQLEQKYEVVRLTFGEKIERNGCVDFSDNRTDIAGVLEYIDRHSVGKQPEALVLLSDGIYNSGLNPLYNKLNIPIFTVALGDTTRYPDVIVQNILVDKFNFIRTIFPLKAEIKAFGQAGRKLKCVLKENGNKIEEKIIQVDKADFLSEIQFEAEAVKTGVIKYTITVEPIENEYTLENNTVDTWVNIIDNSGDITLYADVPHPDIAALVNAIQATDLYRCSVRRPEEWTDTVKTQLIILHNPDPGNIKYQRILQAAEKRKLSIWYILTKRKSILDFSRYQSQYSANLETDLNEYATVDVNRNFPFFELSAEEAEAYRNYPPLVVPFGGITTGAGRILFHQKIKGTSTENGMLGFYETKGNRICYFWGEGLWRWKLYSYRESGNHELFHTLIHKIIGYLAIRNGAERFVHDLKTLYNENEQIVLNAELYNESFQPVNTPEIALNLKHEGKEFDYQLPRYGDKYRMNMGNLPAGEYNYRLTVLQQGESLVKTGVFYVRSYHPELNNLVADHTLLKEIAEHTHARMISAKALGRLAECIQENTNLKSVYKEEIRYVNLKEVKIIGLFLLLLLCIEWFLLKWYAG